MKKNYHHPTFVQRKIDSSMYFKKLPYEKKSKEKKK
jgi:hypothetical protein